MGLTSLIEFSLQWFDYVNVARRKRRIFLHVIYFHVGGSPEQICSFLPMETLQLHTRFSPYKN